MASGNTRRKLSNASATPCVIQISGSAVDMPGWKFKNKGGPLRLQSITGIWVTAGGGGTTLTVRKKAYGTTTAIGSATAMTAALALSTTAETQVTGTLSSVAGATVLNTNDILGVSGTMTSLAGALITLTFVPVG